jgi:glycosyltransferase involved in cell wall biosynthesis
MRTSEAPRLYYLDDIPTPYRLVVQRRIAESWEGSLKIAYCAAAEPGRDWSFDFTELDVEVLSGCQYRPKHQVNPFSFKWNPMVLRSLRAYRPDVVVLSGYVHPTMLLAAYWCRRHGVPYGIASESNARNSPSSGLRGQLKRRVAGWMVRGMSFGLPVGREAGEYLRTLGPTDAPMYYFPNTPDTSAIAVEAERVVKEGAEIYLRQSLGIPEHTNIVLFVGRMIDAKRPMDALQAFLQLGSAAANATLVFVGDGPLLDAIKTAADGNERVVFTGWLRETSQVATLMAISSTLVLPSEHETWGAVVNEAMAAGTPVIASDRVGAAAELIEPGLNGLIYPVGQTTELARAIGLLLTDEAARQHMGRAAQVTALESGHQYAASNLIAAALHGVRVACACRLPTGHGSEARSHKSLIH